MNDQSWPSESLSFSVDLASDIHAESDPADFSGTDIDASIVRIKMLLHLIPIVKIFNVHLL